VAQPGANSAVSDCINMSLVRFLQFFNATLRRNYASDAKKFRRCKNSTDFSIAAPEFVGGSLKLIPSGAKKFDVLVLLSVTRVLTVEFVTMTLP